MRGAELHLAAGAASGDGDPVVVTPETAGWDLCGLRVVRLAAGDTRELRSGPDEIAVLPLSGGRVTVEVDGRRFELVGRRSVFARVTDWAYVPRDAELRLSSGEGCELALASARATRRLEPVHVAAESIAVEIRGAGSATRQVTNFLTPDEFDGADKLICCELVTPDGNWSSYPPHTNTTTPTAVRSGTRRSTTSGSGAPGRSTTRPRGTGRTARTRTTDRSTRPLPSATAMCSWCLAGTTGHAPQRPAIRCTTST